MSSYNIKSPHQITTYHIISHHITTNHMVWFQISTYHIAIPHNFIWHQFISYRNTLYCIISHQIIIYHSRNTCYHNQMNSISYRHVLYYNDITLRKFTISYINTLYYRVVATKLYPLILSFQSIELHAKYCIISQHILLYDVKYILKYHPTVVFVIVYLNNSIWKFHGNITS